MTKFVAFMRDESGASAAEYVLILAIIGSAIAVAAGLLGTAIHDKIEDATAIINGVTI
jgi:pilus assembly protein Flp/PilA